MLFTKGQNWAGVRDADPKPGLQEVPRFSQDQWLSLIRILMSAGDLETLVCRTEELHEYDPVFFRSRAGQIELSTTGDFDDDEDVEVSK
jgi:hypothetical protein